MADNFDKQQKNLENRRKELEALRKDEDKSLQSLERSYQKVLEQQDRASMRAIANFAAGRTAASQYQATIADQLDTQLESLENQISLAQKRNKVNEMSRLAEVKALQEEEESIHNTRKALEKKAEVFSDISKTLKNIPGIGGLLSDVFSDAAAAVKKTGNFMSGVYSASANLLKVVGPAALLKAMLNVSDQTFKINQNLGLGFESSRKIREEFAEISETSNDVRINSERLLQAQLSISKSFGLSVKASGEVSQNFIRNTRYLGASEEAAANLEKIISITGQNSTEFTESLAAAANQSGKVYGVHLPLSEVVENIKNLQGEILISIMRSPEALTKAVAVSKKLGIEFSKVKDIAAGLTDFESSITSELEAEVLLGKEINLNRARQLAFTGQYVALGEELTKQVGSLAEYEDMLPIQRRAFAEAIGMSSDELGNMLLKQELSLRFGKQAKDLSEEQLKAAKALADNEGIGDKEALRRIQEEASATMAFEDAASKVKNAFQDAVVQFTPLIEKVADILGSLAKNPLAKFLAVSAAGLGAIIGAAKLVRGLTPMTASWVRVVGAPGATTGGGGMMMGMGGAAKGMFGFGDVTSKAGKAYSVGSSQGRMILTKGGTRSYTRAMAGRFAGSMGGGMALGGLGMLAGSVVTNNTESAMGAGFGKGLSMAGQGALMGSMILPGWGTAIGTAIGGLYGGVTGYLDKKEAEREAKREQVQKEIDQKGAVAEELRMLRAVMENKDMVIEMNGMEVGKGMTKGANLIQYDYQSGS